MAKTIKMYQDESGKAHATVARADEADAIAALDAFVTANGYLAEELLTEDASTPVFDSGLIIEHASALLSLLRNLDRVHKAMAKCAMQGVAMVVDEHHSQSTPGTHDRQSVQCNVEETE